MDLKVHEVLCAMLGAAKPNEISILPAGCLAHRFPMSVNFEMPHEKVVLFASVPGPIMIPFMMLYGSEAGFQFVLALTTSGPVAIHRISGTCVGDVLNFLALEFELKPLIATDMLGRPFSKVMRLLMRSLLSPFMGFNPLCLENFRIWKSLLTVWSPLCLDPWVFWDVSHRRFDLQVSLACSCALDGLSLCMCRH